MKQKIIIVLLVLSMLLPGCTAAQSGAATVGTQAKSDFISYEDSKRITDILSASFDGFDCNIFVTNGDTGVEFSLSMKCSVNTKIFADFVVWFSANVLEVTDGSDIPISKVDITFFDTITNDLITWESTDGKTGRLIDLTSNQSVIKSITPAEIQEKYGSAELDFPITGK